MIEQTFISPVKDAYIPVELKSSLLVGRLMENEYKCEGFYLFSLVVDDYDYMTH
jgi:hypothetical protein